jgi:hypothetical protein
MKVGFGKCENMLMRQMKPKPHVAHPIGESGRSRRGRTGPRDHLALGALHAQGFLDELGLLGRGRLVWPLWRGGSFQLCESEVNADDSHFYIDFGEISRFPPPENLLAKFRIE